jgi:hypothetical protein
MCLHAAPAQSKEYPKKNGKFSSKHIHTFEGWMRCAHIAVVVDYLGELQQQT